MSFGLFILVTLLLLHPASLVPVNYNYESMLNKERIVTQQFNKVNKEHPIAPHIVVLIKPETNNIFDKATATKVALLAIELNQIDHVVQTDHIFNLSVGYHNGSNYEFSKLENVILIDFLALRSSAEYYQLLGIPAAERMLFSEDQKQLLLVLKVNKSIKDISEKRLIYDKVLATIDNYQMQNPQDEVSVTGYIPLQMAMIEAETTDYIVLYPVMFIVSLLVLILIFRSIWITIFIVTSLVMTIITTLAAITALGYELNQLSSVAPLIAFVICLLDYIHLTLHYKQGYSASHNQVTAITQSLQAKIAPILITKLTTIIGFLALNFSENPSINTLGNVSAMGIVIGWFYLTLFFPSGFALFDFKNLSKKEDVIVGKIMAFIRNTVLRRYKLIVVSLTLFAIFCCFFINDNYFNDNLFSYLPNNPDISELGNNFHHSFNGLYTNFYSIKPISNEGLYSKKTLSELEEISLKLEKHPHIIEVSSLLTQLQSLKRSLFPQQSANEFALLNDNQVKEMEILFKINTTEADQTQFISYDSNNLLLQVDVTKLSNREILDLHQFTTEVIEHSEFFKITSAGSETLLFADLGASVVQEMLYGSVFTFIAITLVNYWIFKSLFLAGLSLLTNGLPMLVAYGVWGIFFQEMNVAAAMSFSIAFGLIVDDTIHMLYALKMGFQSHKDSDKAIQFAINYAGPAILTSTITLCLGLVTISLSQFGPNQTMSTIVISIAIAALLYDLFLIPSLVKLASAVDKRIARTPFQQERIDLR